MRFQSLVSSFAFSVLGLAACTITNNSTPTPDGGIPVNNGGDDGGGVPGVDASTADGSTAAGVLPFTPSNISLAGLDLSKIADEDVTMDCVIKTPAGDAQGCFQSAADTSVTQGDGSQLRVLVVKSLKVEATAHITLAGGSALAIVSIGDFTMLGSLNANGQGDIAIAGGFGGLSDVKGGGTGGGAAAVGMSGMAGVAANGASYCGQGGQGVPEMGAAGTAAPKSAAYGSAELVPLAGGSAGGGGDVGAGAGGGAIQFVSGGTFTLGPNGAVNAGGGGGSYGGTNGQEAGGGGSGGSVLIEAVSVTISGTIAANGGGGGGGGTGAKRGGDATPDGAAAVAGAGGEAGGIGSSATIVDGANASVATASGSAGAGGGGAGRIRINSKTGQATIAGTLSPAASTSCATQGTTH